MQEINTSNPQKPNDSINYMRLFRVILSRWYLVAFSVLLCFLLGRLYLWYTPKSYATSAIMKFDEKKSEISELVSVMNTADRATNKVQSESYVIKSRSLIINAVKDLDYKISFFIAGRIRTYETYPDKPLDIEILQEDSATLYKELISFQAINPDKFSLSYKIDNRDIKAIFTYNQPIIIGKTSFLLHPSQVRFEPKSVYLFRFNSPEDFYPRVAAGLNTSEAIKNSNVINIEETDSNPQFASDILNAIMKEYLDFDRNRKMLSASQIITFIDNQLDYLSKQVKSSEKSLEAYKKSSKVFDVSNSATLMLSKVQDAEAQKSLLNIQLIGINQLKQQISNEKNAVSLNLNMQGTVDPLLNGLLTRFNLLLSEKTDLLRTYTSASQQVTEIDKQLAEVRNAALANINASVKRIELTTTYLNNQLQLANQQVAALPTAERDIVSLKRDFEINDKVYSFLSEKKLEAQISRSSILAGATIIEQAQPNFIPVAPDANSIYQKSILIGLFIGSGLILLLRMLNPYIFDKETIESITQVPVIGMIRKFPYKLDQNNTQILSLVKPKSVFAESVRSVRTNLSFMAADKQSKVICITSEVSGEGKSFIAVNLSSTLALIDKKVILIAADLRRSRLHHVFQQDNQLGLSNFLAGQIGMEQIIFKTKYENIDFIPSGPVPPNPSELLHHPNMNLLIEKLKASYDIIMIDTAPVGLVSDSIPVIRQSDINIFVIRAGKSSFYSAEIPQQLSGKYGLNNTVIILNAYAEENFHSRIYTSGKKDQSGSYYYTDYNGYASSGYYSDDIAPKWWKISRWIN
ncbi:GumC family protein [Mucilaginibacter arboris]|uniref:non-specific protein-tyrosine kinase n=1 Tax=Mucilaginibacter arboris TaxID=2682090 RepID=A0A7K1SU87_9SPHI|nr:tyrosine-protein kinase family protein [Mucilaginibacter arboris]MVN20630.1 polysaccharide biosynthesis tyrosine autokinase [Mucilaginibacter arboris]